MVVFSWTENRTAALLGVGDLVGQEGLQRGAPHDRGVDDLALLHGGRLLEDCHVAVCVDVLDPDDAVALDRV